MLINVSTCGLQTIVSELYSFGVKESRREGHVQGRGEFAGVTLRAASTPVVQRCRLATAVVCGRVGHQPKKGSGSGDNRAKSGAKGKSKRGPQEGWTSGPLQIIGEEVLRGEVRTWPFFVLLCKIAADVQWRLCTTNACEYDSIRQCVVCFWEFRCNLFGK